MEFSGEIRGALCCAPEAGGIPQDDSSAPGSVIGTAVERSLEGIECVGDAGNAPKGYGYFSRLAFCRTFSLILKRMMAGSKKVRTGLDSSRLPGGRPPRLTHPTEPCLSGS